MPACLALVLALLLPAAAAAQTITVHVTRGGSPVADARVTSAEQTVRTNALGLAVLEVSSLPMDIVVAPDEFVTETIHVSSLPKDGRVDVAFDAPPTFEEEIVVERRAFPDANPGSTVAGGGDRPRGDRRKGTDDARERGDAHW